MEYSFKDIYSKAKVAIETDRYVIYQTLKSKLSFSGNYLLIKRLPKSEDELEFYLNSCHNFFKDKGVNFIHVATPENTILPKKFKKLLNNRGYNEINLELYHLDKNNYVESNDNKYEISSLQRVDYSKYLKFQYNIDIESANEEWAEHNQNLLYEDIRSENIIQLVAKDEDKIVASANIIIKTDFFEIDNVYVSKNYRNQGIARSLIEYSVNNVGKNNVVLIADANDTPKYMYERMGFKKIATQDFYLKSNI